MFKVFIVSGSREETGDLGVQLAERGFYFSIGFADDEFLDRVVDQSCDLAIVVSGNAMPDSRISHLTRSIREEARIPVIAIVSHASLDLVEADPLIDDFVVEPWRVNEVIARAERVLRRARSATKKAATSGCLVVDPNSRGVTFKGRRLDLTFREYELLAFLVNNKCKVFSREELLHAVWGVEYYGGARTVDVHIRRLRSKLDESDCLETVRSVGYRFTDD